MTPTLTVIGPTADEVQRASTSILAGRISGLERVGGFGGKAVTLAEGAVYSNDPAKYKKELAEIAAASPQSVAAAARKWMGRPVLRFTLEPGERSQEDIATAGGIISHPRYFRNPAQGGAPAPATSAPAAPIAALAQAAANAAPQQTPAPKITAPGVQAVQKLNFPAIQRTKLSNGIKVVFARQATVPTVRVAVAFDAGNAADDKAKLGTQALMISLLEEGTTSRNSIQIAEEQERLGASINAAAGMDTTTVSMLAMKPNLAPSLDLLADVIRNPAFRPEDVERQRSVLLARIATEKTEPNGIALRTLPPLLYGASHPYGVPFTGSGDEPGVKSVTRDDLVSFHHRWIRPDDATIFVVGDTNLAEVVPLLEARFGSWQAPAEPKGVKQFGAPATAGASRIILIDKPQSPQSLILAGETLPTKGTDDTLLLSTANEVLGGSTTARLIQDLRETKGWAYYAGSQIVTPRETMPLLVFAPVQTDKTGDSIAAALADMNGFLGDKGTTPAELKQTINTQVLSLPGNFESSQDVLGALMQIENLRRPDDYYVRLPERYQAMTAADLDKAARGAIDPKRLLWVVVGDAAQVRPQLKTLGLPVEELPLK